MPGFKEKCEYFVGAAHGPPEAVPIITANSRVYFQLRGRGMPRPYNWNQALLEFNQGFNVPRDQLGLVQPDDFAAICEENIAL